MNKHILSLSLVALFLTASAQDQQNKYFEDQCKKNPTYLLLFGHCVTIRQQLANAYGHQVIGSSLPKAYICQYLEKVGTPIAKQLQADLGWMTGMGAAKIHF